MNKNYIGKYIQIPLQLFNHLSPTEATLLALYSNRAELSKKSGKKDELSGLPYIRMAHTEAAEILGISVSTIAATSRSLKEKDLILVKRNGLGQSNTIIVFEMACSPTPFVKLHCDLKEKYNLALNERLYYGLIELEMNNGNGREYSRARAAKILNLSTRTISTYNKNLVTQGLIRKVRQGLNKPDKIFIAPITAKAPLSTVKKAQIEYRALVAQYQSTV